MAISLVSTTVVGSGGTSQILLTNIPQTGKDLLLVISARGSFSDNDIGMTIFWNDSQNNYAGRYLRVYNTTTDSSTTGSSNVPIRIAGGLTSANTFGNTELYFTNYATTASGKQVNADYTTVTNASFRSVGITTVHNTSTSAITSLSINADIVQNSSVSLYIIS